jgi:hypothetical protein
MIEFIFSDRHLLPDRLPDVTVLSLCPAILVLQANSAVPALQSLETEETK